MDKERSEVNNCHVKWKYNSPDINSCQKNRDLKNLSFLMKSMYTVRHILQRHRAELVLLLVLSHLGSVDLSSVGKCPLGQVNHFNLTIDKEFCCVPVHLPKGYGYKSCTENGKSDTIEACLTEPVRLYQWDDTTTASEATCSAEMQCLSEDNMKIEICDESGQSCHTECVCNFLGGYCGTEYFNCNPFPVDCPKEDVQIDCSCRRSTQLPGSESTASLPLPDIMNSINTDTSSKLSSTSDDIMPYVVVLGVVLNEEIKSKQNKNTSVLVAGADRLSNASCILIVIVSVASVSTVVGTALCILVYVRKKHSKRSTNHDAGDCKIIS
ncbi:hypothetical protein ACJMK2_008441 [Sinanodonta woodiana]|uniref:Uncharacterized protein n=1 Tax=Sinanodonta woodiana TaxID=1069815 RepID=A0ABD3VP58_SINWO